MKEKYCFLLILSMITASCVANKPSTNISSTTNSTSDEEIYNSFEVDSNSNVSNELEVDKEEDKKIWFDSCYSIYLNPSVQYSNSYIIGNTNEGYQMNQLANLLYDKLIEKTNLVVYGNLSYPGLSLSQSIKESNSLNVDVHIALHTNGGGGKGSEAYFKNANGKVLSQCLLNSLNAILPYPTRGVKSTTSLYETNTSTAKATTLVEILFHDEKNQALFLINEMEAIAEALVDGIITYFS